MVDLYKEGYELGKEEGKLESYEKVMKYLNLNELQLEKINLLINEE